MVANDAPFLVSRRLPVATAAMDAGLDVHFAAPAASECEALLDKHGIDFHPIKLKRRSLNPYTELMTFWGLARLYKRVRPDLVHHITIKPTLYGGIAARLTGVPAVVSTITGLGYVFTGTQGRRKLLRNLAQQLYRAAFKNTRACIIFQNPDDRDTFVNAGLVPSARAIVIPGSGIDLQLFQPLEEPPGTPIVVLPGRMLWDKGIAEFVEAAGKLRAEGVQARFVLVGGTDHGNPAAISEKQLHAWVATGIVEWWGYRRDMRRVYSSAHVVCLPSYREGVPNSLLEAAVIGRAIVTTDVPGCREVVKSGENGLLVKPGDVHSLAEALREVITDERRRRAMAAAGRAIVEEQFSLNRIVDETLKVYGRLLEA